MKKIMLFIGITLVMTQGAIAANEGKEKVKTVYMGTKAEPYGTASPCKGKTTRPCAIVYSEFASLSSGMVQVTRTTCSLEGSVLYKSEELKPGTMESVKAEYQKFDMKNGGVIEAELEISKP